MGVRAIQPTRTTKFLWGAECGPRRIGAYAAYRLRCLSLCTHARTHVFSYHSRRRRQKTAQRVHSYQAKTSGFVYLIGSHSICCI